MDKKFLMNKKTTATHTGSNGDMTIGFPILCTNIIASVHGHYLLFFWIWPNPVLFMLKILSEVAQHSKTCFKYPQNKYWSPSVFTSAQMCLITLSDLTLSIVCWFINISSQPQFKLVHVLGEVCAWTRIT